MQNAQIRCSHLPPLVLVSELLEVPEEPLALVSVLLKVPEESLALALVLLKVPIPFGEGLPLPGEETVDLHSLGAEMAFEVGLRVIVARRPRLDCEVLAQLHDLFHVLEVRGIIGA